MLIENVVILVIRKIASGYYLSSSIYVHHKYVYVVYSTVLHFACFSIQEQERRAHGKIETIHVI